MENRKLSGEIDLKAPQKPSEGGYFWPKAAGDVDASAVAVTIKEPTAEGNEGDAETVEVAADTQGLVAKVVED